MDSLDFIQYSIKIIEQFCKKKYKNIFLLNSHGGQISHIDIIGKELKAKYKITLVRGTYFLFDEFKLFGLFIVELEIINPSMLLASDISAMSLNCSSSKSGEILIKIGLVL